MKEQKKTIAKKEQLKESTQAEACKTLFLLARGIEVWEFFAKDRSVQRQSDL